MPTYAGNDTFPELVTIPADGPLLAAATLNLVNEAVLDRTRWLERREQMRIATFDRMVENPNAHATYRNGRPAYSLRRQRWYFGVGSSALAITYDYGASFSTAATLEDERGYHCAFINDPLNAGYGNGIFVPLRVSVVPYLYFHAADTYAVGANLPSATWSGVIHEPVSDNYIVWDVNKIYTTPASAPAVWTARTLPGGGVMGVIPIASNGAGLIMAHGKIKGVYTSNDGGVTWTECTTAFGLVVITSIAWDAWRGRFIVMLTDGAGLAETWWSTDGGTWTMLATGIQFAAPAAPAPANYVFEIQSVGPTLVATHLAATGAVYRLVYSVDGGTTWGRAPAPVWANAGSTVYLANNGSDIVAVNLNTNYKGIAFSKGFAPIAF